ncbi:MAG TPA: putative zinc-binding metallopeptidase [Candidatus Polarisedimenticolia bacterium]|nr:putative zinc-binding metallopeptidase [Candidatus Polarisedimenticolia bacterium]
MAARPRPDGGTALDWAQLGDEELLKLRIRDLGLRIEGTELEARVAQLYGELETRGLRRFRPRVYLGDEWFSPEDVPSISIPFYLAHPRLKALEKAFMLEVEGGTEAWCMKLLRHESGHCFDHAYRISRRPKWRRLFGSPSDEYDPDTYRPRPYSRSYVRHLENWYAQAHPDEDFAETFAVWLDPASDWRVRYARWTAALDKLTYVDELGRHLSEVEPPVKDGPHTCAASRMTTTLEHFYRRKIREAREDYPDFFDADLRRIFDGRPDLPQKEFGASRFLQRHRRRIVDVVSGWTGEKKYAINALVRKLTLRCQENGLKLGRSDSETNLELAAYLATLVTHHLFTGRFKRTV